MNVLSDLSSLVFISQDLSLALGSCAQSRNLEFVTVHVGVSNFVTEEVLLGGLVFKNEGLVSSNDLSKSVFGVTVCRDNFPDSAVNLLVDHAHLLVP